jgi:hypothetical protein
MLFTTKDSNENRYSLARGGILIPYKRLFFTLAINLRIFFCMENNIFAKICALLGYCAASCGSCLPTFRDNTLVPSSRVKSPYDIMESKYAK